MRRQRVYEYVWAGTAVRFLTDVTAGILAHGIEHVIGNADSLARTLEAAGMVQTFRAYEWHVEPAIQALRTQPQDHTLTPDEAVAIQRGIVQVRTVLDVECAGMEVFVTEERRYAVGKLMSDIGSLLPRNMFAELPQIAQKDLADSGQALVYGLGTAAAFHALRATEELLRTTYNSWVPPKAQMKKPWLWKPMVDQLKGLKKAPPAAVLDNLDYLRRTFRNPTDHPELTYDIDEAQELFAACLQSIAVMKRAIDQRAAEKVRRRKKSG